MATSSEPDLKRPERWDAPFDLAMTDGVVDALLRIEPFCNIDDSRFPKHLPLRGILFNDTRVLRLSRDQIVVREGDYGNSAFLVLKGKVCVIQESLPRKMLGRGTRTRRSVVRTIARAIKAAAVPETRVHHTRRQFVADRKEGIFLQDVPRVLNNYRSDHILPGELFGEIAALGRTPRTATIIASEEGTEILELRWQGLRDLMNFAPDVNAYIEERFRKNGLLSLLHGLSIINRLPAEQVQEIVEATRFERYGKFDWYGSYEQLLDASSAAERLKNEPLILQEGDYMNGLLIIRGGFVRVSRRYNHGEQTSSYLGKGQHFGLKEIYHNMQHPSDLIAAQHTLRAVGYVDVLVIPTALVEAFIIPKLTPGELKGLEIGRLKRAAADKPDRLIPEDTTRNKLGPGITEFFMDKRAINGRATMLIDLDRCTRCDDCVRACASTHDGNPRFIRHGDSREGIQVTQACMHCHDPICMIPCPTGAIHRLESGDVVVNDDTCIGCSSCADNCPYNNIQMVDIRDRSGHLQYPVKLDAQGNIVRDEKGNMIALTAEGPVRRATKCDLCSEHLGGPACVRACPHDALMRFDMQETDKLAAWLSR